MKNLEFSILDIFISTTEDKVFIERECWWKKVLKTRVFGCNIN